MSQVDYGRQTDIIDPDLARNTHITICGLGTVGSHAAVELARMGIGSLHLIDADVVEGVNLPSQAYHVADIDRPKAEACADRVREVSDHVEVRHEVAFLNGGEAFDDGPVILAVDNMDARKDILELSVADRPGHPLLIDGRMAGKMWQLLALDPCNPQAVERWLSDPIFGWFPQDEALDVPCGGRTVSFVGSLIGGLIASYVCLHLAGKELPLFMQSDCDSFHITKIGQPQTAAVPA